MLKTLSAVLTRLGYQVTALSDSLEAVELTRHEEFDLIVTDIRMPGIDGLEALERVRQTQPDVRSLVVTGYSTEADSIRAIRLGVGEYLQKPFRLEQFREAVGRLAEKIQEDQRKIAHETALCQTLIWSLESLACPPQLADGLDWIPRAGRLTYRLSLACELPPRAAELLQLGCLWWSLEQNVAQGLPPFLRQTLPESVQPLAMQLQERAQTDDTLIVGAAQLLSQGCDLGSLPEEGRSYLQRALQSVDHGTPERDRRELPAAQRRSTLSLALALEEAGELGSAGLAYADVAGQPGSRESTAAALGLARLAKQRGDKPSTRAHALLAVRIARSLGPLCLAGCGVQAGTLLASAGATEAVAVLEEAAELLRKLGFTGRESQARLALGWLKGPLELDPYVGLMLQNGSTGDLADSAWWLLPILLEACARQPSPILESAAQRVLAESASAALLLLSDGRLSAAARRALAGLHPPANIQRRLLQDLDESVRQAANLATGEVAEGGPPTLRLFTLGCFEIHLGTERVDESSWKKNQKAVLLLAYLATQGGRPVPEEMVIEAFWPQEGARRKKHNLYSVRSILRRSLRSKESATELDYVTKVQGGLVLDVRMPIWNDYEELLSCLKRCQQLGTTGHTELELCQLRRAQQLYRGPFLETCYMDWAGDVRHRLERQMVDALLRLGSLAATIGSLAEIRECCEQVLEIDDCCEEAYQMAIEACLSKGQRVEAIKLFERCQKALFLQLQAEPSGTLVDLYERARLAL